MRRVIVLLMLFTGLLTVIIGIAELSPRHHGLPVHHIVVASTFATLCLIHIFLNRKAIVKYITGSKQGVKEGLGK